MTPFRTISHYAATMHENPTRGNNLPYNEAVAYNQRKAELNRHPKVIPDPTHLPAVDYSNKRKPGQKCIFCRKPVIRKFAN